MIQKLFTVYDSKAETYLQPFCAPTKGIAIRSFQDSVRDTSSNLHKYPEDFTLFELGSYDQSKATFSLHPSPQSVGVAIEFLEPKA